MLRFISIGSGTSGNSYLLLTDSDSLMIDAGIDMDLLRLHCSNMGVDLSAIKRVLITHEHVDHVKCVGELSEECGALIYATEAVHAGINSNSRVGKKVEERQQVAIARDTTLQLGDFKVTPFLVPHDCCSEDCVGYIIEIEGAIFSIITDCGHITERIGEIIGESNYLVIESNHDKEMLLNGDYPDAWKEKILSGRGHLSNAQCAEALVSYATPELRHVWLCHLSEENNHPELARKTIEYELRRNGIIAGKDFRLDVLKRKQPMAFDLKD